jgi:hypothetical protein
MDARIVREDGTEADYGESGELWLTGGNRPRLLGKSEGDRGDVLRG